MIQFGLIQTEIEAILAEGLKDNETLDAAAARTAIAQAIVKNNEAVVKQVMELFLNNKAFSQLMDRP